MPDALPLLQDERDFHTGSSASDSMALLCPEQETMVCMKNIICKLTIPGDLIADCCAGIFSAVKACIILPQHKLFVESDLDLKCVALILLQLVLTFVRQVLNSESHNARENDMQQATFRLFKTVGELSVILCTDV